VTPTIKKLTIGVKCADKMFRVNSEWGAVVDAVLALRAEAPLSDPEYFKTVGTSDDRDAVQLDNRDKGTMLRVTVEEIIFSHTQYDAEVDVAGFHDAFNAIWPAIDRILKVRNVRRIGIVAEHRIVDVDQPSRRLVEALTKFGVPQFAGRFHCSFERRVPTIEALAPDLLKSDFKNVIHHFYDAEMDASVPAKRAINANLDVQRYYGPALASEVIPACKKARKEFEYEWAKFGELLVAHGLAAK
jgi:hypothetical protein